MPGPSGVRLFRPGGVCVFMQSRVCMLMRSNGIVHLGPLLINAITTSSKFSYLNIRDLIGYYLVS